MKTFSVPCFFDTFVSWSRRISRAKPSSILLGSSLAWMWVAVASFAIATIVETTQPSFGPLGRAVGVMSVVVALFCGGAGLVVKRAGLDPRPLRARSSRSW